MPTALDPAPSALGLSSPALGPWFSDDTTLPTPDNNLSVKLVDGSRDWLPPASSILGLFLVTAARAPGIAHLRDGVGEAAFVPGSLVALLRLLPEVEERLHFLARHLPSADGVVAAPVDAAPTRARVRYLALEIRPTAGSPLTFDQVWQMIPSPPSPSSPLGALATNRKGYAEYIGLRSDATGATLANHDRPMTHLQRPGKDPVLKSVSGGVLWAFDALGHAIDPGAVAAWWSYLATTTFSNLWQAGVANRTAKVAAGRFVHLVNPHGGALSTAPDELLTALTITGAQGTGVLRSAAAAGSLGVAIPAAPTDAFPQPRVALLPNGAYGDRVTLFPGAGTATPLQRDYVRVAAVEVESFLVGQRRTTKPGPTSIETARAASQALFSTMVPVARCSEARVLCATSDDAARSLLAVYDWNQRDPPDTNRTRVAVRLATSVVSRDFGGLDGGALRASLPVADLPGDLASSALTAFALEGGGSLGTAGGAVGQRVLVKVSLGTALKDAWVRIWPEGFDERIGEHVRMDGGAGRVDGAGDAYVVVTLPDGPAPGPAPLGVNVLLVVKQATAAGKQRLRSRLYADKRFPRPVPAGGAPVALSTAHTFHVCEAGTSSTGTSVKPIVPSGSTVVATADAGVHWALVSRASVSYRAVGGGAQPTLEQKIAAGDLVSVVQPAFPGVADHHAPSTLNLAGGAASTDEATDGLASSGVLVDRIGRATLAGLITASAPLPTLERLEIACSVVDGRPTVNTGDAAIGSAPTLGRYHELLPHHLGHPGAPGAVDIHGTGARLAGAASVLVAEHVRDRTAGLALKAAFPALPVRSTEALLIEALEALPRNVTTAPGPSPWAAVLATVSRDVEGEPAWNPILHDDPLFPFGQRLDQLLAWLRQTAPWKTGALGSKLADLVPEPTLRELARALDRRVKIGYEGAREGAISIEAALRRAEDFVYLETPALDNAPCGPDNDPVGVFGALLQRVQERPGLRVLICVPLHLLPGTPRALHDVRDAMLLDAIKELRAQAEGRFAVFVPSAGTGRSLRLASTTVIVDDAYALTGTTHLSRRGLSFDASLAAAVFDEHLDEGRPADVRRFRRALIAGRLGVDAALVPDDPIELVDAVRHELTRGGGYRFAEDAIRSPDPLLLGTSYPTDDDKKAWNPDGTRAWSITDFVAALRRSTPSAYGTLDESVNQ